MYLGCIGTFVIGTCVSRAFCSTAFIVVFRVIVGFAIAYFGMAPGLSPVWRLFVITGLAGGLSTFSTFSAELLTLLRDGRLGWSAGMLALHVGGSLTMTALGMASASATRQS